MRNLKILIINREKSVYPTSSLFGPPRWIWGIYEDRREGSLLQAPYTGYKTRKSCVRSLNRVLAMIKAKKFVIIEGAYFSTIGNQCLAKIQPGWVQCHIVMDNNHLGYELMLVSGSHRIIARSSTFATSKAARRAWAFLVECIGEGSYARYDLK